VASAADGPARSAAAWIPGQLRHGRDSRLGEVAFGRGTRAESGRKGPTIRHLARITYRVQADSHGGDQGLSNTPDIDC